MGKTRVTLRSEDPALPGYIVVSINGVEVKVTEVHDFTMPRDEIESIYGDGHTSFYRVIGRKLGSIKLTIMVDEIEFVSGSHATATAETTEPKPLRPGLDL